MNATDKLWIKSMEWADKYWGCHQIPERSFYLKRYQLPVCARCTGMIIGELAAIAINFFASITSIALLGLMFPMIIDGLLQYFTSYTSNNTKRLLTGTLFGLALISLVFNGIKFIF